MAVGMALHEPDCAPSPITFAAFVNEPRAEHPAGARKVTSTGAWVSWGRSGPREHGKPLAQGCPADTNARPAGGSSSMTLAAAASPALATVILYVARPPASTDSGPVFLQVKSGCWPLGMGHVATAPAWVRPRELSSKPPRKTWLPRIATDWPKAPPGVCENVDCSGQVPSSRAKR